MSKGFINTWTISNTVGALASFPFQINCCLRRTFRLPRGRSLEKLCNIRAAQVPPPPDGAEETSQQPRYQNQDVGAPPTFADNTLRNNADADEPRPAVVLEADSTCARTRLQTEDTLMRAPISAAVRPGDGSAPINHAATREVAETSVTSAISGISRTCAGSADSLERPASARLPPTIPGPVEYREMEDLLTSGDWLEATHALLS